MDPTGGEERDLSSLHNGVSWVIYLGSMNEDSSELDVNVCSSITSFIFCSLLLITLMDELIRIGRILLNSSSDGVVRSELTDEQIVSGCVTMVVLDFTEIEGVTQGNLEFDFLSESNFLPNKSCRFPFFSSIIYFMLLIGDIATSRCILSIASIGTSSPNRTLAMHMRG